MDRSCLDDLVQHIMNKIFLVAKRSKLCKYPKIFIKSESGVLSMNGSKAKLIMTINGGGRGHERTSQNIPCKGEEMNQINITQNLCKSRFI